MANSFVTCGSETQRERASLIEAKHSERVTTSDPFYINHLSPEYLAEVTKKFDRG